MNGFVIAKKTRRKTRYGGESGRRKLKVTGQVLDWLVYLHNSETVGVVSRSGSKVEVVAREKYIHSVDWS